MARANDFVDPEYDRKLAEFKAMKERMKKERVQQEQQTTEKKY